MELCSLRGSQMLVGKQRIALGRKGSRAVLPACLLEMAAVLPEFCNSSCGGWVVDVVTWVLSISCMLLS